jgi:hypothetical protein
MSRERVFLSHKYRGHGRIPGAASLREGFVYGKGPNARHTRGTSSHAALLHAGRPDAEGSVKLNPDRPGSMGKYEQPPDASRLPGAIWGLIVCAVLGPKHQAS